MKRLAEALLLLLAVCGCPFLAALTSCGGDLCSCPMGWSCDKKGKCYEWKPLPGEVMMVPTVADGGAR